MTTHLLTCKDFLSELSAYLDEQIDPEMRAQLEKHVNECPNCWVVADTTKKTIKVFKGMDSCSIPESIHDRLMAALEKKIAAEN